MPDRSSPTHASTGRVAVVCPRAPRGAGFVAVLFGVVLLMLAAVVVPMLRDDPPPADTSLERALRLYGTARLLDGRVLASASMTRVLETWCDEHDLADPAVVRAVLDPHVVLPATPEVRTALSVDSDEPVAYREVQLRCGDRLLATAGKWWVPSRVSEQMRRRLTETDEPFDTVVRDLDITRRTVDSEHLWPLLPHDWQYSDATSLHTWVREHRDELVFRETREMFRHEALVVGMRAPAGGRPIALVYETYRQGALAFSGAFDR